MSSGYSAQLAGVLGLPFAFAHHFSAHNTVPALELYRRRFRPSPTLPAPHAMICVHVLIGDSDAEARHLTGPAGLAFVRLRQGRPARLATPDDAARYPYSADDRLLMEERHAQQAIGAPSTVRRRLAELLAETQADELMITTITHGYAEKERSFAHVRALFGDEPLPRGLDSTTSA